jgi:hypothetical protein
LFKILRMKNYVFFFLLIVLSNTIWSQISITQYDMPQAGDVYLYQIDAGLLSADVVSTGSNYEWDFSQPGSVTADTLNIVGVTATPLAYQLYFNNALLYPQHKANYAIRGDDFDGFGQVTIEDRYDFYKKNPGSLEIVGFGANINGIPASVRYDTIQKDYHFPMQFEDVDYSTGFFLTTIPNLGTYGSYIRRNIIVDGWGSIQTPEKYYANALRVTVTLDITDTLYSDQFGLGFKVNRPTETRYEWWTNEDHVPVFVATKNANQLTSVKYLKGIVSGINEPDVNEMSVQPTSSPDVFKVVFRNDSQQLLEIKVYDIKGVEITNSVNHNTGEFSLSETSGGVYLIVATTTEGKIYATKVVK